MESDKESQLLYYVNRVFKDTLEDMEAKYWSYAGGEQFEDEEEAALVPEFVASDEDWPPEEIDVQLEALRRSVS